MGAGLADDLSEALEVFEICLEAESENRDTGLEDYQFARLAMQWPEEIRRKRVQEGRPCLTVNRMPQFGRQVVNEARQQQIAIKVRPVDDNADVETAEVMAGLIRNIEQQSNADAAYDTGAECAVYMGVGYWRIGIEYAHDQSFDKELKIIRIPNRFSVYEDPFSTESDSSDWNHGFVTEWMEKSRFHSRWPDADEVSWDKGDQNRAVWADEDGLQVAEYWKRTEEEKTILLLSDGTVIEPETYEKERNLFDAVGATVVQERKTKGYKVRQLIMNAQEVLEENDWAGCYIPIVPCYGEEMNLEGKRIVRSLIHDAKDAQQMLNFWRSATTELVALAPKAPFIGPEEAFQGEDSDKWETANTDTYSYLSYQGSTAPQRQAFAGVPAGAMQEALTATDDMKSIMGIYDASLGARSSETSGVAINARKVESDTATFHFVDNLARAVRHTGKILVDLLPKVYTAPRVVRILGLDGTVQNVKLGERQQTQNEQAQEGPQESGPAQALTKIYDLSMGRYDVAIDVGPNYVTQRQEAADQMMQLVQSFPQAAPIIGDLIAKNLDWPGAQEMADRLKAMLPPKINDGIPPELTQQMEQMQQQLMSLTAENEALKSKTALEMKKDQTENRKLDLETDKVKAESFKFQAEGAKAMNEGQAAEAVTNAAQQLTVAAQSIMQTSQVMGEQMQALAQIIVAPKVKRATAVRNEQGGFDLESVEVIQ